MTNAAAETMAGLRRERDAARAQIDLLTAKLGALLIRDAALDVLRRYGAARPGKLLLHNVTAAMRIEHLEARQPTITLVDVGTGQPRIGVTLEHFVQEVRGSEDAADGCSENPSALASRKSRQINARHLHFVVFRKYLL